jgi:hypothetical protein
VLGAVICGLGLIALIGSWGGHWYDREIQVSGGRSVGHVTDKHFSQPDDWDVNYWFLLPDGQRVDVRHRSISGALWQRLKVDDLIDVHYELKNPARNFPVNEGNTPIAPVIVASVIGLAFTIAGLFLIMRSFKHRGSSA